MIGVDLNRPPYVQWEIRPMEDREASLKNGHYTARDVEIAIIMRPGSKDRHEKIASEFLSEMRERARKGEVPPEWPQAFKASYDNWKLGEAEPVNGTSIKSWPAISPAQAQNIIKAGIFTIEDLAALPDSELPVLPIGGHALRQKARSWIEAATDKGKLAEENAALKQKVEEQTLQIAELAKGFQEMKATLTVLQGKK